MFFPCVSKKKLTQLQSSYNELENARNKATADLSDCDKKLTGLQSDLRLRDSELANLTSANKTRVSELEAQLADLRKNNNSMIDRMADLSVVSKAGAESNRNDGDRAAEQQLRVTSDLRSCRTGGPSGQRGSDRRQHPAEAPASQRPRG